MPSRSPTNTPPASPFSVPLAALTIAGSDSGGGAGIQADLRTFAAHGLLGCTAITAITAQNTLGVTGWEPVSPALVGAQIEAVLADLPVRAAKTGMLGTSAVIARVVAVWQTAGAGLPLVVDPVMVATSGDRLLDADAELALRALLRLATVITPNLPEAAVLSGLALEAAPSAHAEAIAAQAPQATVVVKGGHRTARSDEARDLVRYPDGATEVLSGPWVETRSTHGTGCTLSAAITAGLALGRPLPDALRAARAYLAGALEHALPMGAGHGPVDHLWALGLKPAPGA